MPLNHKNIFLTGIFILILNGCGVTDLFHWNDTKSLEEYGDKVMITMATLVTYIGKSKEDVKQRFGEPTEMRHESGLIHNHYKEEKVPFNEIWSYIYHRGIPGINAEGSIKDFYFYDDKVVSVDAF